MRLVIAEKHSVAQAIGQALGGMENHDGYITAGGTLISWAQGHLIELAMPGDYEGRGWDKWNMDALPIDPSPDWRWNVSDERGAARQYANIRRLLDRDDVTELVNACDPDREGEAIFRRITSYANIRKPTKRLWVASLEEEAIRQAFDTMKPESAYDGLAHAAEIRAKADWLIGMNASRAYSLAYNTRFTVGRVQTPTLAMVVDRDMRIENHVPQPCWHVEAPMGGWTLSSERIENQASARDALSMANSPDFAFHIESAESRREHDAPPRLYDLTGLQKDMSKLHGLTAARTLAALQSLYEKKLATYPRTDSRYITHDDLGTLRNLVSNERADGFIDPETRPAAPRLELTVNDAKVAGHTAILPTARVGKDSLAGLGDDERLVLIRVVRRMWEAVSDDHVHDVATVKAIADAGWLERHMDQAGSELAELRFSSRSDQTVSMGWKAIEQAREQETDDVKDAGPRNVIPADLEPDTTLPPVPQGGCRLEEGKTQPPKPFTEATLLAAMEHASRYVDDRDLKAALDDDESHSGGIGTPATRADVIEKLIRSKYVERKGKQLRSTQSGRNLIAVVNPSHRNVEYTARMENSLSQVEHGEQPAQTVMELFQAETARIPAQAMQSAERNKAIVEAQRRANAPEPFGPCPRCGQQVVKTGRLWQCSSNRREKQADGTWKTVAGCGYKIYPEKFGKPLTDTMVRRALEGRKPLVRGFVSKAGKAFDARLVPDKQYGLGIEFDDRKKTKGR
ncbi:DNA topoisomerase [Bifidobacterium catenulatum]|uniref:type IA DNA topoisomerase n=1 Tax=Bifidobacterium catenulatum TaxID=1686 RepID=UPI003F90579D